MAYENRPYSDLKEKDQFHDSGVGSDDEDMGDDSTDRKNLLVKDDVEAQPPTRPSKPTHGRSPSQGGGASEFNTSAKTKLMYLAVYFFFNLALTLYNKFVLGKVSRPRPVREWENLGLTCLAVRLSMATHHPPFDFRRVGMLRPHDARLLQADTTLTQ